MQRAIQSDAEAATISSVAHIMAAPLDAPQPACRRTSPRHAARLAGFFRLWWPRRWPAPRELKASPPRDDIRGSAAPWIFF
jgi:hypothetical protein